MASSAADQSDPPIIGINGDSSGNDLIRVEASVTFNGVGARMPGSLTLMG